MRVVESVIVSDVFAGPVIRDGADDALKSEGYGVGFGHLGNKDEHGEAAGVEVSDGEFSQKEIATQVSETDFVDRPFSVDGVVIFASVVFFYKGFSVVGEDVLDGADFLEGLFADFKYEFFFGPLEHR